MAAVRTVVVGNIDPSVAEERPSSRPGTGKWVVAVVPEKAGPVGGGDAGGRMGVVLVVWMNNPRPFSNTHMPIKCVF